MPKGLGVRLPSPTPYKYMKKILNIYEWHPWFAWYPIYTLDDIKAISSWKPVWLRRVWRKRIDTDFDSSDWIYNNRLSVKQILKLIHQIRF